MAHPKFAAQPDRRDALLRFVVAVGALAFLRMGRSILPPISFPIVTISAPYAGAGTDEIERLVVMPIEDQLNGLPQLDRISSYAQDGIANSSSDFVSAAVSKRIAATCSKRSKPRAPTCRSISFRRSSPTTTRRRVPILSESITSGVIAPRELARDRRSPHRAGLASGALDRNGPGLGRLDRQFTVVPRESALKSVGMTSSTLARDWFRRTTFCPAAAALANLSIHDRGALRGGKRRELRALPVSIRRRLHVESATSPASSTARRPQRR